ncbi:MAG: DUF421 domain-containing protein [Ignavibacteriae bacterium]|nr:DUF421 domain-containing protein [Ignavibacteriota bacterium]
MTFDFLEIVGRSVVVYLFIVIAIRIAGKKELAQLSVIDLVFILLISNSVQNAMVGPNNSLLGGIIAATSLFIVNIILKVITYRYKKANKLIEGEPVILIHNGKLIKKNLDKEKIPIDELQASIREHGVENIEDVNLAILENDGNISIISDNFTKKSVSRRKSHKVIKKNN